MMSQAQAINKILQTKDFSLVTLNNLGPEYFYNYKAEFDFIKNHVEMHGAVPDRTTFANAFPDFDIFDVSEPDSYILEQLNKDYNTAYLAKRFNEIKRLIESGDTEEAVNYFRKSVDNLHQGAPVKCTNLLTDTSRYERYLERASGNGRAYIRTGFDELDYEIGGIDPENENMVIAARTGVGKCLEKGTLVRMADGSLKAVEDVVEGDEVQSWGRTNKVVGRHSGVSSGYEIIPLDGYMPFVVSDSHILTLVDISKDEVVDIKIEDYLALPDAEKKNYRLMRAKINYFESGTDEEMDDALSALELGKDIDHKCLCWNEGQRRKLLSSVAKFNPASMTFSIPATEENVDTLLTLARGLGLFAVYNEARGKINFLDKMPAGKTYYSAPFAVKERARVEYYGFMTDGDHRFLLADGTVTHNTWTLVKMAVSAAQQGLRVGIYSGEMTADKIGYRVDTLLGKINNKAITRGDPLAMQSYKNYVDGLKRNDKLGPIFVVTPADIAGPATVPALKSFIDNKKLDILFIDQYSLLEDANHAKSTWEKVSNISKAVKNLQVMSGIPIISVSQMNRTKNEDNSQDTTQIGLSDRIGQDATVVLMLDRDKDKGTLTINIVKARDGGDGKKLTYQSDFNSGTFRYIEENPTDEQAAALANSYEANSGNVF